MGALTLRPTTKFMMKYFKFQEIVGAELGVFEGRNSRRMLDLLNIKRLYLVDLWKTPTIWKGKHNLEAYYEDICIRYKNDERVQICKDLTTNVSKFLKNNSLDFVYIDADHNYECCLEDIINWYPLVKKGGIICGHDYYACEGVKKAVDESFEKSKVIIFDAIGLNDKKRYGEWLIIKE